MIGKANHYHTKNRCIITAVSAREALSWGAMVGGVVSRPLTMPSAAAHSRASTAKEETAAPSPKPSREVLAEVSAPM